MRALYAIWVSAMTLALFSVISFVMFGVFYSDPAFPSDNSLTKAPPRCLITRVAYDQTMNDARHPLLLRFPSDLSRRFIISWNNVVRGSPVPATADNVTLYDNPRLPLYRVAFFRRDCLLDAFDIGEDGFWKVVELTHGPQKYRI